MTVGGRRPATLVRAGVPEQVTMVLTGHQTRAVFDRDNSVQEAELHEAGARLLASLADQPLAAERSCHRFRQAAVHGQHQPFAQKRVCNRGFDRRTTRDTGMPGDHRSARPSV